MNCFVCEEDIEQKELIFYYVAAGLLLSLENKQKETEIHYKCFSAAGGFKKWFISGSGTRRPEDFYNCRLCGKKSTISYFGFYDLQKKSFACFCLTCASRELYDLQVQ